MHLSFSFLALGAAFFSLSHASGLSAPFSELKNLDRAELVRLFGEATPSERWSFFQSKYQNYLDENISHLTTPQINALHKAIEYAKAQDTSLTTTIKDELVETLGKETAVEVMQVVSPPAELVKRNLEKRAFCECLFGQDSCGNHPSGPICHMFEGWECVPDLQNPCAENPEQYCSGVCGS